MAVAPITGSLRRKIIADITVGITLGAGFASYWWWGFHKKTVAVRENYYAELAKKKAAEDA
ncbi:unnamed protein product [Kuraishia capsulata CBS 1993]|uniref:Cytochrome c oxidase subunit 9, mitochondrial n=1 Tax=Kuraishia capsulata CBS 1993 TaxID=1382522 RepID=W6MI15_9ASCO|nr:uncharacterized protein KUCA_T00001706001 [Kuraishia capsulata CBS 1993]CDK25736.1 unnamed protein product [Kuraishia capsulata CBS 1993]